MTDFHRRPDEATAQIRGSSGLLVGRVGALLVNGAAQVILVRSFSKESYGRFAYALSIATMIELLLTIMHRQSLTRFLSIYNERRERSKVVGTLVMALLIIAVGLIVIIGAALVFRSAINDYLIHDGRTTTLVLIVLTLGALEAVDDIFEGGFAVLSRPRVIFLRKYLLTPSLQLALVAVVVLTGQSIVFLAWGTVCVWAIAVGFYGFLLLGALRKRGLLEGFSWRHLDMPFREVLWFGVPLITTQLFFLSINNLSIVILQRQGGPSAVAVVRAVIPIAQVNQLVLFTFTLLFMPLAARLYERDDRDGIRDAYWHTAVWLTALSFPIFAMTGPMARPVILTLFGSRYADAIPVLALLSLGLFFNAMLGFNALTLQTYGRLKEVALVNLTCIVLNVGLNVVLIEHIGALGLAVASCVTLVLQNVMNQVVMHRQVGIEYFDTRFTGVYASVVVALVGLVVVEQVFELPFIVATLLVTATSLAVLRLNRHSLRVSETFPEIGRLPFLGAWLS